MRRAIKVPGWTMGRDALWYQVGLGEERHYGTRLDHEESH